MSAGVKLATLGAVVAAVVIYLAYSGAAASWQYYVTVDECLADAATMTGQRLRVSGRVAPGSLRVDEGRMHASFALAGESGSLAIVANGSVPDNLVEGREVVVEGRLAAGNRFDGEKIVTKCASKYQSSDHSTPASSVAPTETEGVDASRR